MAYKNLHVNIATRCTAQIGFKKYYNDNGKLLLDKINKIVSYTLGEIVERETINWNFILPRYEKSFTPKDNDWVD